MSQPNLRTRLRALVEERRYRYPDQPWALYYSNQLAAILDDAEEPEACSEWRHCEHDGEDGHVACDVLCADCGMRLETHPPKPLPLGHPHDALYHTVADAKSQRCAKCGQPREAHE